MDRWLARLVAAQGRWAKPFGDFNNRWLKALFRPIPAIRDLLNGRWLGHPLHGVLTDAPIGILFLVIVLDVLDLRTAADVTLIVGILTMLAAAVAGAADYADTDGTCADADRTGPTDAGRRGGCPEGRVGWATHGADDHGPGRDGHSCGHSR